MITYAQISPIIAITYDIAPAKLETGSCMQSKIIERIVVIIGSNIIDISF